MSGVQHAHCSQCASVIDGSAPLCLHHAGAFANDWAADNRVFCDFIHRHVEPPHVALPEWNMYDLGDVA